MTPSTRPDLTLVKNLWHCLKIVSSTPEANLQSCWIVTPKDFKLFLPQKAALPSANVKEFNTIFTFKGLLMK